MEPRVVFLGFDATGTLKCQWESDAVRTFHSVNPTITPNAIEIGKPAITPKKPSTESHYKADER